MSFDIQLASENGYIIYCHADDIIVSSTQIRHLSRLIEQTGADWLIELLPAYKSVLVTYDPLKVDHFHVNSVLKQLVSDLQRHPPNLETSSNQGVTEIPVCYEWSHENDLDRIADYTGLTHEQIIGIHAGSIYQVFCLGFSPGFAFMGQVDARLAVPRLDSPRKSVPRGAVAIADQQTAIYPSESPGGWNIIGRCPLTLFNPDKTPYTRFEVGERIKFNPISVSAFNAMLKQSEH